MNNTIYVSYYSVINSSLVWKTSVHAHVFYYSICLDCYSDGRVNPNFRCNAYYNFQYIYIYIDKGVNQLLFIVTNCFMKGGINTLNPQTYNNNKYTCK